MIAWDHSARAARAVGDALPILQAGASVRVVTVADDKADAAVQSGTRAGQPSEGTWALRLVRNLEGRRRSIGKVLGSWANSHAMDAIVMGATIIHA